MGSTDSQVRNSTEVFNSATIISWSDRWLIGRLPLQTVIKYSSQTIGFKVSFKLWDTHNNVVFKLADPAAAEQLH